MKININGDVWSTPYVDEYGHQVKRTKIAHPYNYDGFVLWRCDRVGNNGSTIYSDRLLQWDFDKHDELCMKHFGNKRQWWNDRDHDKIEAFLRDWIDNQNLHLFLIMEYCNQSTGYPVWRFDYTIKGEYK